MTRLLDEQLDLIVYSVEGATFSWCFDWAAKCCAILRHFQSLQRGGAYIWLTCSLFMSHVGCWTQCFLWEITPDLCNIFALTVLIWEKLYHTFSKINNRPSMKVSLESEFIVLWFLEIFFFKWKLMCDSYIVGIQVRAIT